MALNWDKEPCHCFYLITFLDLPIVPFDGTFYLDLSAEENLGWSANFEGDTFLLGIVLDVGLVGVWSNDWPFSLDTRLGVARLLVWRLHGRTHGNGPRHYSVLCHCLLASHVPNNKPNSSVSAYDKFGFASFPKHRAFWQTLNIPMSHVTSADSLRTFSR